MKNYRPSLFVSSPQCAPHCSDGHGASEQCQFQVQWSINPHMKIGEVDSKLAAQQHRDFLQTLAQCGADLIEVPFVHGAYDSVFTKDNAVIAEVDGERRALLAKPRFSMRTQEILHRQNSIEKNGIDEFRTSPFFFEGGDFVPSSNMKVGFLGYGFRTDLRMKNELEDFFDLEVQALELIDPYFYHLDTALGLVHGTNDDGEPIIAALACRSAFSESSWRRLQFHPLIDELVEIPPDEALQFGLNWVELNDFIVMSESLPTIKTTLHRLGKTVVTSSLSQFHLAGGSAACLTSKIHQRNLNLDIIENPLYMTSSPRQGLDSRMTQ